MFILFSPTRPDPLERVAGLDSTPDPGRLEQELVILLGRTDISEELDRLLIHLRETENLPRSPAVHRGEWAGRLGHRRARRQAPP